MATKPKPTLNAASLGFAPPSTPPKAIKKGHRSIGREEATFLAKPQPEQSKDEKYAISSEPHTAHAQIYSHSLQNKQKHNIILQ